MYVCMSESPEHECMYVCLKQVANVYVCLRARSVYVWMSEALPRRACSMYVCMSENPEHVCMSDRPKQVCMYV